MFRWHQCTRFNSIQRKALYKNDLLSLITVYSNHLSNSNSCQSTPITKVMLFHMKLHLQFAYRPDPLGQCWTLEENMHAIMQWAPDDEMHHPCSSFRISSKPWFSPIQLSSRKQHFRRCRWCRRCKVHISVFCIPNAFGTNSKHGFRLWQTRWVVDLADARFSSAFA